MLRKTVEEDRTGSVVLLDHVFDPESGEADYNVPVTVESC